MTTSEGILKLREKLGFGQKELAQKIGVSARSVARYEAGTEPSHKVLKELASLANSARLSHLQNFFEAKRRADIVTRVESLPSAASERRLAVADLADWIVLLEKISKHARDASITTRDPESEKYFQLILQYAGMLDEDMKLYLAAPDKPGEITWDRIQKIETLLDRSRNRARED
jgi:transcriptional regulator with XRE-family HTH domain